MLCQPMLATNRADQIHPECELQLYYNTTSVLLIADVHLMVMFTLYST
jgi:hypothetical protein